MPKITDTIKCKLRPMELEIPRKMYAYLLRRGAVEPKTSGRGRPRGKISPR